jgi:hypothetical protein
MQHFSPEIWKEVAAWWDDNIKMDLKEREYVLESGLGSSASEYGA